MHIPTRAMSRYPLYLKPLFWLQRRKYGKVLEPGLLWARVPRLFLTLSMLYGVLDRKRSPLEPVLRSLVTVRVSQINWCAFCVDINSAALIERAGSAQKVDALEAWRESDLYTERERVALEYCEAITFSDRQVQAELMNELKRRFTEDEIVELTGLVAFQNMSSKFNSALDVEPQGFCSLARDQ